MILVCAVGIRKGAVGMVYLDSPEVQERCVTLGHTNAWKIPGTEDLKPDITAKDKGKSGCSAQLVWRSLRQHWRRL